MPQSPAMDIDTTDRQRPAFPSTHWSQVAAPGKTEEEAGREALGALLMRYQSALTGYAVGHFHISEDAGRDLFQAFVEGPVLRRGLIAKAELRSGSRFRSYLLKAWHTHIQEQHRREHCQKRWPPGGFEALTDSPDDSPGAVAAPTSEQFDRGWALALLAQALDRMRLECEVGQRADIWGVFVERRLRPAQEGTSPLPYDHMSPDTARGEGEDTRADIYSFGALLYEMLTGRPPYQGRDRAEVVAQVVSGPPPPVLTANPKAPRDLAAVVGWAMARELCDRYAHMAYVLADLDRISSGKAPVGPRGTRRAAVWRQWLGNRWLVSALIAVTVLGLGALTWFATRPHLVLEPPLALSQIRSWVPARPIHLDGDRLVDWVLPGRKELQVVTSYGELLDPIRPPEEPTSEPLDLGLITDVDGDGLEEVFVSWA